MSEEGYQSQTRINQNSMVDLREGCMVRQGAALVLRQLTREWHQRSAYSSEVIMSRRQIEKEWGACLYGSALPSRLPAQTCDHGYACWARHG